LTGQTTAGYSTPMRLPLGLPLLALVSSTAVSARADDRSETMAILASLDVKSADPSAKQATESLERGTRMRNAGDEAHARLAEGLALECASAARDRARTVAEEKEARTSQLAAIDTAAHVERERSLLEAAIARGGRLRAELAALMAGATKDAKTKDHTNGAGSAPPPKSAHPAAKPLPSTDADAPGHAEPTPKQPRGAQ
jgi:hypothetical protein